MAVAKVQTEREYAKLGVTSKALFEEMLQPSLAVSGSAGRTGFIS